MVGEGRVKSNGNARVTMETLNVKPVELKPELVVEAGEEKPSSNGFLVSIVGATVGLIVLMAVLIPVSNSIVMQLNDSGGAAAIIAQQIPTLNAVVALVIISGLAIGSFSSRYSV